MGSPIAPKTKKRDKKKWNAKDEWETPQYLFDALHAEFNFTIDAFATRGNAKCKDFYIQAYYWHPQGETIFMNPPYSELNKAVRWGLEMAADNVVVMLLPVKTDNNWWVKLLNSGAELRFYRKRFAFEICGIPMKGAPFTSMVAVLR